MKKLLIRVILAALITLVFSGVAVALTFDLTGTFASQAYQSGTYVDQLLNGSFSGTYSVVTAPEAQNWPSIDSFDLRFYSESSILIDSLSSSEIGDVGYFYSGGAYDYLLFYDSTGYAPYLQLSFDKDFVGVGPVDVGGPAFTSWYNGATGGSIDWLDLTEGQSSVAAPVPEPSTFLLLGGGLAGLAFYTRRRRKE